MSGSTSKSKDILMDDGFENEEDSLLLGSVSKTAHSKDGKASGPISMGGSTLPGFKSTFEGFEDRIGDEEDGRRQLILDEGGSDSPPGFDEFDEPPPFSHYTAQTQTDGDGNIISHDAHLNEDGEALFRFLLMQADIPPQLFIQITGTHTETRYETITETRNGQTSTRTETKQYTVTDFDFSVDCNEVVPWDSPKRMFVVPDGELCYRGGSLKEFGGKDWRYDLHLDAGYGDIEGGGRSTFGSKRDKRLDRRRSNWADRGRAEKAKAKVKARGLPPFVPAWKMHEQFSSEVLGPWEGEGEGSEGRNLINFMSRRRGAIQLQGNQGGPEPEAAEVYAGRRIILHEGEEAQESRLTYTKEVIRAWCDRYCWDKSPLKEFRFRKVLYGWDWEGLERDIQSSLAVVYAGEVKVTFRNLSSSVIVRPDSRISRIFSLPWYWKIPLWILLVMPILYLAKFLFFGATFDVVRTAFPIAEWKTPRPDDPEHGRNDTIHRTVAGQRVETKSATLPAYGVCHLTGVTEKQWLEKNEHEIIGAAVQRKRGRLVPRISL